MATCTAYTSPAWPGKWKPGNSGPGRRSQTWQSGKNPWARVLPSRACAEKNSGVRSRTGEKLKYSLLVSRMRAQKGERF